MTLKMVRGFALAAALTASPAQQPVMPQQTADELEPILAQVATFDAGQSREGLFHLTMFVQDSMSSPALLGQIEARLLQFPPVGRNRGGKRSCIHTVEPDCHREIGPRAERHVAAPGDRRDGAVCAGANPRAEGGRRATESYR
jgi:hypothetical protein